MRYCGGPAPAAQAAALRCEPAASRRSAQPRICASCPFSEFPDHWRVQLNDTIPRSPSPELMRVLLDEKHLELGK